MKLSACLIIRDEERNLEACLSSIRPHVDEICIVDTGSSDSSPSIAKKYADKWEQFTGCNDKTGKIADFSLARNVNLRQATGDAVLWLDGDDVLHGGAELRKLVSEAPRSADGSFQVLARYEYDRDAAGRVVTLQWRERLIGPPAAFEWRAPVHEGLLGKAGHSPVSSMTDRIWLEHRRREVGKVNDPERNLRILRAWFAANGEADPRLMHYYGVELLLNRHMGEALYWLRRHIAVAPWSDEKCLSLMHLARFQFALGDYTEAIRYALEGSTTKSWPEPYWLIGQAFCALAENGIDAEYNYKRGATFMRRGFQEGEAQTLLMIDPTMRYEAHAWSAAALGKLGQLDSAIEHAQKCLEGMPEHETAKKNLELWLTERARNQVRSGMVDLHKLGAIQREAGIIVESALTGAFEFGKMRTASAPERAGSPPWSPEPRQLPDSATIQIERKGTVPFKPMRIAFWLGHQLEPWTPETLEQGGMGGSEVMAWEMAKRLAKLGHRVEVFGHCEHAATYEGVYWTDASKLDERPYDILIVSRQAGAVTMPHSAKVRVLWVHDVHCGPDLTPQIASRYDWVWCLSEWHKQFFMQCYPWLASQKVEVTRNGIDLSRFTRTDIARNPHRAIYSSSPDRGLVTAIKAWPEIRKRVPEAELHCYYGFDNWERSLILNPGAQPAEWESREALTELKLLAQTTEGVVLHGRVNQRELAEAMLGAGVWCYPTWFSETSCITAMEAQAAGLVCVCPSIAALAETVEHRYWTGDLVGDMERAFNASSPKAERYDFDKLVAAWDDRLGRALSAVVPAFSEVQP